jgi:hypothetical protein
MKNTFRKILAVGMTLALVSSFFAAVPVSAAPGCNDWGAIGMPVLDPYTEPGVMEITPDGELMFLAVYYEGTVDTDDGYDAYHELVDKPGAKNATWDIMYSEDGGFTWEPTNLTGVVDGDIYDETEGATPVKILASPMWPNNKNVYVALSDGDVWRLPNAGLGTPALLKPIVSNKGTYLNEDLDGGLYDMDIWADGTYNYLAVATDLDVFILKDQLLNKWEDYELNDTGDEVLDTNRRAVEVRFAPDFAESELIWAVVAEDDNPNDGVTWPTVIDQWGAGDLILTSADSPARWGYVYDEQSFWNYGTADTHQWTPFVDMEFDPDYSAANPQMYVGIAPSTDLDDPDTGNLYFVNAYAVTGEPGPVETNYIFFDNRALGSVEVSGDTIMVLDTFSGEVWTTTNAGSLWTKASRDPAAPYWGELMMAPDFAETGEVFATVKDANWFGDPYAQGISGVYRSTDSGVFFDGISLLDMIIDHIVDLAFDPKGGSQPVLMVVDDEPEEVEDGDSDYIFYTADATAASPQWLLKDSQHTYDLDGIEMISWDEAGDTVMFVGYVDATATYSIYRSTDDGNSFKKWRDIPTGTIDIPQDWYVVDGSTLSIVGLDGYWGVKPFGTAITKSLFEDAGNSIARDGDTIAIGTSIGSVYVSTDAGNTWEPVTPYATDAPVFVAFGPDGKLYAAGAGGAVKSIGIGATLTSADVKDSESAVASATLFSGIWVSPDNTIYAMGAPAGVASGSQIDETIGSITLGEPEEVSATYVTGDAKIVLSPIMGGSFNGGETLNVYAADVKAISSSMASGIIKVKGASSGAKGYVNIEVYDAANPFSMFEKWPADLSVTFDGVIVASDPVATGETMFRLLLGEKDNVWENKSKSGADGLWGTTGSNLLWTVVDQTALWAFEDFNSGKVQDVTVTEVDKDPTSATKTLEISWTALACTSCYEIYVDGEYYDSVNAMDGDKYYKAGTTLSTDLEYMDYATEYDVQVRACAYGPLQSRLSAVASTTTQCYDVPPTPLVPVQGMQDASLAPSFVWAPPTDGCAPTKYDFQLSTDPNFGTLIVDTTVTGTGYTYTARDLDYDTNHYWRVRSVGADGTKSAWTTIQNFHTMLEPKDPIEITQTSTPAPTLTVSIPPVVTVPPAQTITVSVPPAVTLTQTVTSVPTPTITMPDQPTPAYIWVIVAVGAILTIAVIVLIIRTRRAE